MGVKFLYVKFILDCMCIVYYEILIYENVLYIIFSSVF